jgi:uncharacterized protein (TIGR00255 family)
VLCGAPGAQIAENTMRSMTGFGMGEAPLRQGRVTAEVRSLNHRFLELRIRLPPELVDHTFFVEQLCRERVGRGRYDVSVRVDGAALPPLELDIGRARALYTALGRLRDELNPGSEVPFSMLSAFPGLMVGAEAANAEPSRAALAQSLGSALDQLDLMRHAEGASLAKELIGRLEMLRRLVENLREQAPNIVASQERRLSERVARLLGGTEGLDPSRLAMEVALLADRCDITEELVRLGSHFGQFEALTESVGPSGRKLDFLLQEMAREANTVGAKCQDASLSHLVVSLKAEIERLREQVQNIE